MFLRLFTLLAVLVSFCRSGYSQHYIFNRLSMSDGLLSNNVRAVWQDKTGYLWLGTENGLQRYDGNRFRTIINERTEQIFSDLANRVWIRMGKRVGILNTTTFVFTPVAYENSEAIHNSSTIWLRKDASGNVCLQLTGKNYQYFDEETSSFSTRHNPFKIPGHLKILDVAEDLAKGRYWIVSSKGLGYWDKATKNYYTASNKVQNEPLLAEKKTLQRISDFFIDNKNVYWLLENNNSISRFLFYNSLTNIFEPDTAFLNHAENNSYFEIYGLKNINDSTTAVYGLNYFRIRSGLNFYNLKSHISNPYGIQFNSVSDVLQDEEGIIWAATDNGLYYTSNILKNLHIVFSQEQNRSVVSGLAQDHNDNLWIATWGRGIFLLNNNYSDPDTRPVNEINDLGDFAKMAWTLCEDNQGNMWIGFHEGKLLSYNLQSKKTVLYQPPVFKNNAVRQITRDSRGLLWIGLNDGNIFTLNPSAQLPKDRALTQICALSGAISRMVLINNRYIWVAVNGKGIDIIDTDSKKIIHSIDVQKTGGGFITRVKDILRANDSLCIIAGEKLATVNSKTFEVNIDVNNISPPGTIYTLQKDADNYYWLGGSNGICKLNLDTRTLTKYSQQDGLLTIHNNSYIPERSIMLRSGRMVFGGNQHLVVFDPADYNTSVQPPDVTITGFQLNNRYLPPDSLDKLKEISILYEHRAFAVEFAALAFRQRGKLVYEYKLEGLDKAWSTQSTPAPVKYNVLPHGRYRFLVRAKNEAGQYSQHITSLHLFIAPPFWKTTWFYMLLVTVFASLLFYLHRLRLQKLLHVERVRSRLARDLHDDMGSTLSTINILSNMALQQKPLDETRNREYMSTINTSTSQMMEAMDDIVWSINPANDSIAKIIARMKETAGAVLEPRQIEYRFDVNSSVPELRLSMEARREIFLVFKEALNNIIKYADCTGVVFTLTKKGSDFILVIEDNGKGFRTPADISVVRGNGLKNMQKRATNIKGQLFVKSEPGKGTTIQLSMPIA
ncbi:hypothetical protein DC498_01410 [Terrimonas sp.]|uniref:ligand-binding sensor domain-containing protein n=1 Tax=Terrimonas sp. TaxID=1914338 RepID=UPI000D51181D|nr:sensor histidine kinase [Terrimonas sp.]PVD54077.1 hypothetical protein DC498_01410 [Terrimonas sp.]